MELQIRRSGLPAAGSPTWRCPEPKKTAGLTPDQTRLILVDKARALESRGRPDMAIQLWQQILLSDPKNIDALAGLAKDYKMIGSSAQAEDALNRLKRQPQRPEYRQDLCHDQYPDAKRPAARGRRTGAPGKN